MKKMLIFIFLLPVVLSNAQSEQQLKPPKVDERVELMSIVFRLAGAREYNMNYYPAYVEAIETHFEPYRDHEVIRYAKKIRKKRGVAYDAVMSMAIHISSPPSFDPLVPFSKSVPDARWGEKGSLEFLSLLRQFYQEAKVEAFFASNQELYKNASERFLEVYKELDISWYQKFYGELPEGEFKIVNAIGNGGGNYGPKLIEEGNEEVIYAIMGTWKIDTLGQAVYSKDAYFPILLHEFNHSFVNHLVEKNKEGFRKSGPKIYQPLKSKMSSQAYGNWLTMYCEAIVRAAVVKYMIDHNFEEGTIQEEIRTQISRGFIWTKELVAVLNEYDQNREKYPTLDSFMPELVTFFIGVADNFDTYLQRVEAKTPRVVSMSPFPNGSNKVQPGKNKMIIQFNQALEGEDYSINYGKLGKEGMPTFHSITYGMGNSSIILECELLPNKKYEFILTGSRFVAKDGYGLQDYKIHFKTSN